MLQRSSASPSRLVCATRASARELVAIDLHDLVLAGAARRPQTACRSSERSRISPLYESALRPRDVDIDPPLLRHPLQHPLPGVVEPMALGRVERAGALATFVVGIDRALQAVRRAAEQAHDASRACRACRSSACPCDSALAALRLRRRRLTLPVVSGATLGVAEHGVGFVDQPRVGFPRERGRRVQRCNSAR